MLVFLSVKRLLGPLPAFPVVETSIPEGNLHVIEHIEVRNQVKALEYKAYLLVTNSPASMVKLSSVNARVSTTSAQYTLIMPFICIVARTLKFLMEHVP